MEKTAFRAVHHQMQPGLNLGELLARHPELQIDQDAYNINVTANNGLLLAPDEVLARYSQHDGAGKPAHLYFHLPLCSYICHFCNYVKTFLPKDGNETTVLDRWTDLLIAESTRYVSLAPWLTKAHIESFYIGGGTASLLQEQQLARLMAHVRKHYLLTDDCELTLEGNPDNFVHGELEMAMQLGFNRFSVGIQSFQDAVTRFTGRGHDSAMSVQALVNLQATGRPFNADMMFGLPHQTTQHVREDIRTLIEMKVPTITIYRFRNAERHKMGIGNQSVWNIPKVRDRMRNEGLFPTLQETYAMRQAAVDELLAAGYMPSPCGWWNAPGTYPDGNIPRVSRNKWQRYDTMIAFGPGAYGWLTGGSEEIVQTHNEPDIAAYAQRMEADAAPPLAFGRLLTGHQAVASTLGFAFKANQPITLERFRRQFDIDLLADDPYRTVMEELLAKGLLQIMGDHEALKPTLDGEALHEEIISVYLHQRIGQFAGPVCRR